VPAEFWAIEAVIFIMCSIAGWDEAYGAAKNYTSDDRPIMKWWAEKRRKRGHLFVKLGVLGNVGAIWWLVRHTGGGIESPFVPLLVAPAIFGSFVAQTWQGIVGLVVVTGAGVSVIARWDSPAAHGEKYFAYLLPQLAILAVAGFISSLQVIRDQATRQRMDELSDPARLLDFDTSRTEALGEAVLHAVVTLREQAGRPVGPQEPNGT